MVYTLTCKDKAGLTFIHHTWSLHSESDVIDRIYEKYGWEVLEITAQSLPSFVYQRLFGGISATTSVPIDSLISFYRQFAMMQENHVNLNISLELCEQSSNSKKLAGVCHAIHADVKNGRSLPEAMAAFPYVFDRMSAAMINSGIKSNDLAHTLEGLAASAELSYEMDKKINNASIYPLITLTIAVVVLIVFSFFVIPKFMPLYNSIPGGLPFVTKMLIGISDAMVAHPWAVGILLLFPVIFFKKKRDIARSAFVQHLFHVIPGIRTLTRNVYMARYLGMLSQLSQAKIPILQEIRILEEASAVSIYRNAWRDIADELENGSTLSDAFGKHADIFPPIVLGNLRAAEKSGDIAKAATFLADFYTRETKLGIANIQIFIEPIFVVLIAGFVGTMLFGMFVPLFDITKIMS